MIDEKELTTKSESIEAELQRAFGFRSKTLARALRKSGRRFPAHLHMMAGRIVEAQSYGGNPKLMRMVDRTKISTAYDEIMAYLKQVDPKDRRTAMVLDITSSIVLKLLAVGALVLGVLIWRGYL